MEEVAERTTETKTEPIIESLEKKVNDKDWVAKTSREKQEGETVEYLIVESKEGYEFIIEVDKEKEIAKIIEVNKTAGEKYMITYHPNGGAEEATTVEVRKGFYTILEKNAFTKTKYIFAGWCEKEEPDETTTIYLEGSRYQPTEDITLYAIWREKPLAKDILKVDSTATEEKDKSPYVKYNNLNCRVLYNDDTHGLQLITAENVETMALGYADTMVTQLDFTYNGQAIIDDNFKKAAASYNGAVDNLNNKAKYYMDTTGIATDARCLGSIPTLNNKLKFQGDTSKKDVGYGWSGFMVKYEWDCKFKTSDDNYKEDAVQLNSLGLNINSGRTWLASRIAFINLTNSASYYLFMKTPDGTDKEELCFVFHTGTTNSWKPEGGFRPIFLISPKTVISHGDGSSSLPYVIE